MKKFLLVIDGPMGAGKTTTSKILHEKLKNVAHIGLDRIKWFVSGFKRTTPQNEMTRSVLMGMARAYLKQGVSVILEQAIRKDQVVKYKKIAKANKARFLIYQLEAPKDILFKRVIKRPPPPGKSKVARSRIIRNYKIYNSRKPFTATILNSKDLTAKQVANHILKDIMKG